MLSHLKAGMQIMGPAFLVSVAYLDPGNWATAIESGSRFGCEQLWVLVLSNVIAVHLQALASRLGLVTGKHLAQVCRDSYPPLVCQLLWLMTEVSIVALDLTMVLGTAIGLNLLFKIPEIPCILLTGVDAIVLLLLVPHAAIQGAERWTAALVALVLACFVVDLFISNPPLSAVVAGLVPTIRRESIYSTVSLLGANVMPHNFYLHSALVTGQAWRRTRSVPRTEGLCYLHFVDIACALGLALCINVAVLLVASATFHSAGVEVVALQEAHDLLEQILNSRLAPRAFGLALLLTGQMSTFTGTIAGQVVMSGFLGVRGSSLWRRLGTRGLAILVALSVQVPHGASGIYRVLVVAQVVLALLLPFTLIPLIKATSSPAIMGPFASSRLRSFTAWAATVVVFAANVLLILDVLWSGAQVLPGSKHAGVAAATLKPHTSVAAQAVNLTAREPWTLLAMVLCLATVLLSVMLLVWMLMHPVQVSSAQPPWQPSGEPKEHPTASWQREPHESSPIDVELGATVDTMDASLLHPFMPTHHSSNASASAWEAAPGAGVASIAARAATAPVHTPTTWHRWLFGQVPVPAPAASMQAARMGLGQLPSQRPFSPEPVHPPQLLLTHEVLARHTTSGALHNRGSMAHSGVGLHAPLPPLPIRPLPYPPPLDLPQFSPAHHRAAAAQAPHSPRSATETEHSVDTHSTPSVAQHTTLLSSHSIATEPGGQHGHRLGKSSRRAVAQLFEKFWGHIFDVRGSACTQGSTLTGGSALTMLCGMVDEFLSIPGANSMLEHVFGNAAALHRAPSVTSLVSGGSLQTAGSSVAGSVSVTAMPPLRSSLCAHAAVVQAVAATAGALHAHTQVPWTHAGVHEAWQACASAQQLQQVLTAAWVPGGAVQHLHLHRLQTREAQQGHQRGLGAGCLCAACAMDINDGCLRDGFVQSGAGPLRLFAEQQRALFCSAGIWAAGTVLQLAAVEPRPELWGRYVAALNHLQGVLRTVQALAAPIASPAQTFSGQQQRPPLPVQASQGERRRVSGGALAQKPDRIAGHLKLVQEELLELVEAVVAHVRTCGPGQGAKRALVAAFSKGKGNVMSLTRRLRVLLRSPSELDTDSDKPPLKHTA